MTRLHQLADETLQQPAVLLKPRDTERILESIDGRRLIDQPGKTYMSSTGVMAAYTHEYDEENIVKRNFLDSGENLPRGVLVSYFMRDVPQGKIKLRFADADGNLICEFSSMDDADREAQKKKRDKTATFITAKAGWNNFVWDMRLPASTKILGDDLQFERMSGPTVVPGEYQVALTVGENVQAQTFRLLKEANSTATVEESQQQFDLLMRIYKTYESATEAINTMRSIRAQLKSLAERLDQVRGTDGTRGSCQKPLRSYSGNRKADFSSRSSRRVAGTGQQGTDPIRRLSALPSVVGLGEYPPADQSYAVYEKLSGIIQLQLDAFTALAEDDLRKFNESLSVGGIAFVE